MTLLLTFVLVTVSLTALFLGISVFLQPFLYSEAADHLGLRSLVGGLILGVFLTGWTYINTRASHPHKYDTLLEFVPTSTRTIDQFQAVHRLNQKGSDGQWVEEKVSYKRATSPAGRFVEAENPTRAFTVSGSRNGMQFMTVALMIPPPGDGEAKRFRANLTPDGTAYQTRSEEVVFTEVSGSRYVEAGLPGVVYAPSLLTVIVAIVLNMLHYVVWFAVFWPVLRYNSGTALGLACGFGLLTMLTLMPLLFEENRL